MDKTGTSTARIPERRRLKTRLLQQFTGSELTQCSHELERAVESHLEWLTQVNRSLVCGTPPARADISETPHLLCAFGRWYVNLQPPLSETPDYAEVDAAHQAVHAVARELLLKRAAGEPIEPTEYDHLSSTAEGLRQLLRRMRSTLQRDLTLASKLMAKVFENATEGVLITTPDGTILTVNAGFTATTGYSADEAVGQTPKLLNSGRQGKEFYDAMWRTLLEQGRWEGEIWNRRKNGDVYLEWLSISAVHNEAGALTHWLAIFSDITQEKANEERLFQLAHFDPLTELPNRVLFQDRVKQALARARRKQCQIAVLFLDLDGFKKVNDELGHEAGDAVLTEVGRRLREGLRESDTISRFGGDEFTVVIQEVEGPEAAAAVAAKVLAILSRPYELEQGSISYISASVGISLFPEDGKDVHNLVRRADLAMYQAKNAGKNRCALFNRSMEKNPIVGRP